MTAQPKPYVTEAEYLVFERASITKHEYYNGRIYAMTGASERHNLIAGNTLASLHPQLRRKPCRIYPSDMRVKIQQTGLNTYPDIVIVCGQPQFTDDALDTLTNPTVIIEVLSPSTERYDRGVNNPGASAGGFLIDCIAPHSTAHILQVRYPDPGCSA